MQRLLHKGYIHCQPTEDSTRGQGRILAALKASDGVSTRALALVLDICTSSLNESLAKLERNGYITREPSDDDKRVMLVKLTDKGREETQAEPLEFVDLFDCLSPDEQSAYDAILDKLIAALDEKFSGKQGGLEPCFEQRGHGHHEHHEHHRHHRRGGHHEYGENNSDYHCGQNGQSGRQCSDKHKHCEPYEKGYI
jgi:DNA-binding MarR family transcriptional regulator